MKKICTCDRCGGEFVPWDDDYGTKYIGETETLCKDCLIEEIEEYLQTNLDDAAELLGWAVVKPSV